MNNVDFEEAPEVLDIAKKLQEKYYAFIGSVNLDSIYFTKMIGYKSRNAPVYIMSGLTQAWARSVLNNLQSRKNYCLGVWEEEWDELEKSKKEWIIFRCLYSISPADDGKIRPFDVQDYGFIVEYFVRIGVGPYWEAKENLPSLLDSDDILPLIIPLDENE